MASRRTQNCQINPENWKCSRNIKILIGCLCCLVICLLIIVTVLTVEQPKTAKTSLRQSYDHNSPPCPHFWILYEKVCYYFSENESNWTSSQYFCSSYNASLISITNENKDFVMRQKCKHSYWTSLRKDPSQGWKWPNGENVTLKVIGNGGNCAYLNDEGSASSSRCSTIHHWICHKPSVLMGPDVAWKEDDKSQLHRKNTLKLE